MRYHPVSVRRMMGRLGMSPKTPELPRRVGGRAVHYHRDRVLVCPVPVYKAKRFARDGRGAVRVRYLPVATPELSVMEQYRHQAKRDVPVSEHYATFEGMKRKLSEHLRTAGFGHGVMEYIGARSRI